MTIKLAVNPPGDHLIRLTWHRCFNHGRHVLRSLCVVLFLQMNVLLLVHGLLGGGPVTDFDRYELLFDGSRIWDFGLASQHLLPPSSSHGGFYRFQLSRQGVPS